MARVRAGCVQAVIQRATGGDADSVKAIGERAGFSHRSMNRIMGYPPEHLLKLHAADQLLTAAGGHLDLDCDEGVVE